MWGQTMDGLKFCQIITRNGLRIIENDLQYANCMPLNGAIFWVIVWAQPHSIDKLIDKLLSC